MKKILFISLLLFLPFLGVWIVKAWTDVPKKPAVHALETVSVKSTPDTPSVLRIPTLSLEVPVESVGMDGQGRMDVPKNADNVAWYNLGIRPGEKGNAVIAGHFDKESGAPAAFYNIEKLQLGDTINITDSIGQDYRFSVVRIDTYPYDTFPLEEVFGASEKHMLNLITCEGKWNKQTKNYSHRRVIYTEMISKD